MSVPLPPPRRRPEPNSGSSETLVPKPVMNRGASPQKISAPPVPSRGNPPTPAPRTQATNSTPTSNGENQTENQDSAPIAQKPPPPTRRGGMAPKVAVNTNNNNNNHNNHSPETSTPAPKGIEKPPPPVRNQQKPTPVVKEENNSDSTTTSPTQTPTPSKLNFTPQLPTPPARHPLVVPAITQTSPSPPPPAVVGPPPRPPPPAVIGPPPRPEQFMAIVSQTPPPPAVFGGPPPPAVFGAPPVGRGGPQRGGRGGPRGRGGAPFMIISEPSVVEASFYYPIVLLFTRKNFLVARALVSISDPAEMDYIAPALVNIFAAVDKVTELVYPLIAEEVKNTENKGTLFRGICIQAKVLSACSILMAKEYLKQVLNIPIQSIIDNQDKSCEVNPDKVDESLIPENTQNLIHFCTIFLDSIIGSEKHYPNILRHVCKQLRLNVSERFPESLNFVIGGFYFLRFICPAIIAPDGYGIVKELSNECRRPLILISKVLQNLANGVEFGRKESYMIPLNEFIVANTPRVQNFFDQLAQTTSNDLSHHKIYLDNTLMEKVHVQLFLYHKKIEKALPELEKTYGQSDEVKNFKQVMDLLGEPECLGGVDIKKLKKKQNK